MHLIGDLICVFVLVPSTETKLVGKAPRLLSCTVRYDRISNISSSVR